MAPAKPALRIGLTGGIGSGKSTVAAMLAARGLLLVDTDAIARELTAPGGAAMPALREAFGARAVAADGSLDRGAMRALAFADPQARARLEAILHPMIMAEAQARAARAAPGQAVLFDVPLLAENAQRWRPLLDKVLVLDCSEATQAARVAARPGWSTEQAQRVIAQQAPRSTRRALADAVILNEGLSLESLRAEIESLGLAWGLWNNPGTG